MSLYHEAAAILLDAAGQGGSLKSRVFTNKKLSSPPKQLFALVSEVSKWSEILKEVVERSEVLKAERKLTPVLAILLVHDLLLSKSGIALAASHPLRSSIQRHKARVQAELTRLRVKRGFPTLEHFREDVNRQYVVQGVVPTSSESGLLNSRPTARPRWVRVNTLRSTLSDQLSSTFAEYTSVDTLNELMGHESVGTKKVHVDRHIRDLLAVPWGVDLTSSAAYRDGHIIFQDKASCFPAALLDPQSLRGDLVDACAAPGNKTTHLAGLIASSIEKGVTAKIWAIERDKSRAMTLSKMVERAGAQDIVTVKASQDFLRLKPSDKPWNAVRGLLLDPSCSGSGIVGRDENIPKLELPNRDANGIDKGASRKKRKRPHKPPAEPLPEPSVDLEEQSELQATASENISQRLAALSNFQLKLLTHALSFPSATRVTYSTCSIHAEENEQVVIQALQSDVGKQRGWRILRRERQIEGLETWEVRGDGTACLALLRDEEEAAIVAEGCIRSSKDDGRGTMGFFVAGFIRDETIECGSGKRESVTIPADSAVIDEEEAEWNGISDPE